MIKYFFWIFSRRTNDRQCCICLMLGSKGPPMGNGLREIIKSNRHVTNDVTWSRKVTLMPQYA